MNLKEEASLSLSKVIGVDEEFKFSDQGTESDALWDTSYRDEPFIGCC